MKINRSKEKPEIPTASMADIAFLLIVFFMLTTVFSSNKGMEHVLPPRDLNPELIPSEDAIYIRILPMGTISIDNESFPMDQVERVYDHVKLVVQINPTKPIIVHCDGESEYGDMIHVLNELKRLEADSKLDLSITIPSKQEVNFYKL